MTGSYQPLFRTSPQVVSGTEVAATDFSSFDAQIGTDISCSVRTYRPIFAREVRNVRIKGAWFWKSYFGTRPYLTATPPIDATAASATLFSDYLGALAGNLVLTTPSGVLDLTFDGTAGVSAEIIVPEPATFGGALLAGLVGAGVAWRRRRGVAKPGCAG